MEDDLLFKLRQDIDKIDDEILYLLAKRFEIVNLVGKYKRYKSLSPFQKERTEFVINKVKKAAEENNLDPRFFEKIYQTIISSSCIVQESIINE